MNELYQVAQIAILARCTFTFHNLVTEKFQSLFIDRDSRMEWIQSHDLVLSGDVLLVHRIPDSFRTEIKGFSRCSHPATKATLYHL